MHMGKLGHKTSTVQDCQPYLLIDKTKKYLYRRKCVEALKGKLMEKVERYTSAAWWVPAQVEQVAPLICIYKKYGGLRTIVDLQLRNDNTVKDVTPFLDLSRPSYRQLRTQAETIRTSSQGVQQRLYISQRQPSSRQSSSRQSSSGSSIIFLTCTGSDGHQSAQTFTHPVVSSEGSQATMLSPQYSGTAAVMLRTSHGHPNQIMAYRNDSHPTIYQDLATALGLTFPTPRQGTSSLPPQPSTDRVPVGDTYVSTRLDSGLAPFTAAHGSAAAPEHGHARNSPNQPSETPVGQHTAPSWEPAWECFSLAVWRQAQHETINVKPGWDDEDLVRELKKAYDGLRAWRRLLSLKGPRYAPFPYKLRLASSAHARN